MSFFIFNLLVQILIEIEVLKSPAMIVNLSIFSYSSTFTLCILKLFYLVYFRPMWALEIGLMIPSQYINSYNTMFINQYRLVCAVTTSNTQSSVAYDLNDKVFSFLFMLCAPVYWLWTFCIFFTWRLRVMEQSLLEITCHDGRGK